MKNRRISNDFREKLFYLIRNKIRLVKNTSLIFILKINKLYNYLGLHLNELYLELLKLNQVDKNNSLTD